MEAQRVLYYEPQQFCVLKPFFPACVVRRRLT